MKPETCSRCGIIKTDENTYRHPQTIKRECLRGTFHTWCLICRNDQAKNWRDKNRKKSKANNRKRHDKFQEYISFFKSERPCYDCGGIFPPECMDFDHLRDKKFGIGEAIDKPKDEIRKEIDKCQLVCSNCHRTRTLKRHVAARTE